MTMFSELDLVGPLLRAVEKQNFETPTPIQASAIPPLLEGQDVMGIAQTGGGKTAAFVLPLLQKLSQTHGRPKKNKPRALILAPTRELAGQIGKCIKDFSQGVKVFHTVIYGGAPYGPQLQALARGVDILVATPGRLLDHVARKTVILDDCNIFVLDEADRMLDLGFIDDVSKIAGLLPQNHQTVMFSATMSRDIKKLCDKILNEPVYVEAPRETMVASGIDHRVLMVGYKDKKTLLMHLLKTEAIEKALIFTRTKATADDLAKEIEEQDLRASALHGDHPQRTRERTLRAFRNDRFKILVATDVAARGIDVTGISHVFNFDLPMEPENYIHRVGRTGRAGASGIAISLCEARERNLLHNIERVIKLRVRVDDDHPYPLIEKSKKKKFGGKSAGFKKGGAARSKQKKNGGEKSNAEFMKAKRFKKAGDKSNAKPGAKVQAKSSFKGKKRPANKNGRFKQAS